MAIPVRGSRVIRLDGGEFRWTLAPRADGLDLTVQSSAGRGPRLAVTLPHVCGFVHRDELVWEYKPWTSADDGVVEPYRYREMEAGWVRVEFCPVTPERVVGLIRRGRQLGWRPEGGGGPPVRLEVADHSECLIPESYRVAGTGAARSASTRRRHRRLLTAALFAIGRDRAWRGRVFSSSAGAPVVLPLPALAIDPALVRWATDCGTEVRAWFDGWDTEDQRWFRLAVGASTLDSAPVCAFSDVPELYDFRRTTRGGRPGDGVRAEPGPAADGGGR